MSDLAQNVELLRISVRPSPEKKMRGATFPRGEISPLIFFVSISFIESFDNQIAKAIRTKLYKLFYR
ncbi:hypothetical protein DQM68_14135 [Leptospira mayottensis]|nr:hypothetical protein DQM68_14135 [Leptospira mayottensis]AZQ01907.1 hypothetical protein LEP1GSC190_07585 [Leptospira mayottensis 200901116]TGN03591.1 hypothetical protein EHR03_11900 [Leptospira mayottensis]